MNDLDNDDLFKFQLDSSTINLSYSQLVRYSKQIRDKYVFSDVIDLLPKEILKYQEEFQFSSEIVIFFFQLLKQNYNISNNLNLTYEQCIDLIKISQCLEVRKLPILINEYIQNHKDNVDFIIQMIQKANKDDHLQINNEMENLLSNKINECLSNEKFAELPIEIIYRIIKKSPKKLIKSDNVFNFAKKSIEKFTVLLSFIRIEELSNDLLEELCELYSNCDENEQQYFDFMKCNLKMIYEMNKSKKKTEKQLESIEETSKSQQKQISELERKTNQLQQELKETTKSKNDTEDENHKLQSQLNESLKNKNEIQSQLKETETKANEAEEKNTKLQKMLKETERKMSELQEQLENERHSKIKGQIVASVTNGLIVKAQIKLNPNGASVNFKKSKYIISKSDNKLLGEHFYEKGEPITSVQMSTKEFICKSGIYFVRCIVFDEMGKSVELVSSPVTTRGSSVCFTYTGCVSTVSLLEGKYKLEVWGAKGGNTGGRDDKTPEGGLGGYSSGVLTLNETETAHIYVGGEGRPADSQDGATTSGGFPDGGGTKTGHYDNSYTSVPGTGGGSTSIRLKSDSLYSRVIVAGGGGGASGDYHGLSGGGFGGGLNGGNCIYEDKLTDQGSGTQTGSTFGFGSAGNGDAGRFGEGATGKYQSGGDSGGGGGWYGGGSGGHGKLYNSVCSGGGGGSGWTFTESSFKTWQSGDSTNASKFILNNAFYLADAKTLGGNEEFPKPDGNGIERGHSGNGYAKITPE